jgi:hypothetical protein
MSLTAALTQLLGEDTVSVKHHAARMSSWMRLAGGSARAADLVEHVVKVQCTTEGMGVGTGGKVGKGRL